MTQDAVSAAIYCRMSLAKFGDKTKVDDQARICRELCERRGWNVYDEYKDNSESAWKRNRNRPQWNRMLGDVEAGHVNAIVVYHGDRLARQPYDLELLINLAYGKGLRLASPTGERDLANEDDLFILRIEVAAQCRESAATSRRKKNEYARLNRQGLVRPGGRGGRALCFESDGVTQREDEAELARQAAREIISGSSVRSALRRATAAGLRSTAGNEMSQSSFTRSLAMPRMAGLMPDGMTPAAWPPVLDRTTWELLCQVLSRNKWGGPVVRSATSLLGGIAECGKCHRKLYSASTRYRLPPAEPGGPRGYTDLLPIYRCNKTRGGCGSIRRNMELLDAYVARRTVNRLNDPRNPAPEAPDTPGLATEFVTLTQALRDTDDALADHMRGPVAALLARREGIERRLAVLRELAAGDAAARLRTAHQGISWEAFGALPLSTRRALVAACFTVTVEPASKRGPGFRSQDVTMTPL